MRVKGWEQKLHYVTRKSLLVDFGWGSNDCCLFVAACVDAVTGSEHYKEFAGQYSDRVSAYRFMRMLGCQDVDDVAARFLPEIKPQFAQRADIVMAPGRAGNFLGVCVGETCVGPTPYGMLHFPKAISLKAWKVS